MRHCSACGRPGCRRDAPRCPGPPPGAVPAVVRALAADTGTDPDDDAAWQAAAAAVGLGDDKIAEAASLRERIDALKRELEEWERVCVELYRRSILSHAEILMLEGRLAKLRSARGATIGGVVPVVQRGTEMVVPISDRVAQAFGFGLHRVRDLPFGTIPTPSIGPGSPRTCENSCIRVELNSNLIPLLGGSHVISIGYGGFMQFVIWGAIGSSVAVNTAILLVFAAVALDELLGRSSVPARLRELE